MNSWPGYGFVRCSNTDSRQYFKAQNMPAKTKIFDRNKIILPAFQREPLRVAVYCMNYWRWCKM